MAALILMHVDGETVIENAPVEIQADFGSIIRMAAVGELEVKNDWFAISTRDRFVQYQLSGVRQPVAGEPVLLAFQKVYDGATDPRHTHADEFVPDVGIVRFAVGQNTGTLIEPMTGIADAAAVDEQEAAVAAAELAAEEANSQ